MTAAAAALGDFDREMQTWYDGPPDGPRPDMPSWAFRFAADLRGLLETLGKGSPADE
jgi:hypothetical protein